MTVTGRHLGARPRASRAWLAAVSLSLVTLAVITVLLLRAAAHGAAPAAVDSPDDRAAWVPPNWRATGAVSSPAEVVSVLHWEQSPPSISLLSTTSGADVAHIQVPGYAPMAVRSADGAQLFVATLESGATRVNSSLMAFSLTGAPSLKWSIELPARASYPTYQQGLDVSSDGQFLYYVAFDAERTAACSGDASTCDWSGIGVVNLSDRSTAIVPLPLGCGWPSTTIDPDGIAAICRSGAAYEVSPGQAAARTLGAAQLSSAGLPQAKGNAGPIFAVSTASGIGYLLSNGDYGTIGSSTLTRALPAGARPVFGGVAAAGAGQIAILSDSGGSVGSSIVIFDAQTASTVRTIGISRAVGLRTVGGGLFAVLSDGSIVRVDPMTDAAATVGFATVEGWRLALSD